MSRCQHGTFPVLQFVLYNTHLYWGVHLVPRISGQNCNFVKSFLCLSIPKRNLDIKKTTPNIDVCLESRWAMLDIDFSNSLMIHHVITKEIITMMEVWIQNVSVRCCIHLLYIIIAPFILVCLFIALFRSCNVLWRIVRLFF